MEGTSFFAGLLRGFGTTLLDAQHQQQADQNRQQVQGQKELLDFYLKGINEERLNPAIGYPLVAGILSDIVGGGAGKKGKGKVTPTAIAALADPEQSGQFMLGAHQAFSGLAPTSGAGPTRSEERRVGKEGRSR